MQNKIESTFLVGQFVILAIPPSPEADMEYEVTGFYATADGSDVLYTLSNADGEVLKEGISQSRLTGTNKHNAAAWTGVHKPGYFGIS